MARHRDVRNLDADEFEDEDEDDFYGSSYGSSALSSSAGGALSSSVENYVYKRGAGHTPKMSAFVVGPSLQEAEDEDDEDEDGQRRRIRDRSDSETSSSSSSNANANDDIESRLSPSDRTRMAACLEEICDVMGDTMPEIVIKEAIVRCDFDTQLALNTLLNHPTKHSGGPSTRRSRDELKKDGTKPTETFATPALPVDSSSGVSSTSTAQPIQISSPQRSGGLAQFKNVPPAVPPTLRTVSTTSQLLDQQENAESNEPVLNPSQSTSALSRLGDNASNATTTTMTMRKQALDVAELFAESSGSGSLSLLNLVVVGHVDSGKSTLMGRLLLELGQVSSKALHKFENESRKMGKQSFMYAWVLDETSEERERGITMDIGHNYFETKTKRIHLLDAPGHKDFIPNMIAGAYQADVAILVVNAARGEFEAGFEFGGQTREHALLVRSLGVAQLVVAVNKLDLVGYGKDRFDEIVGKLSGFLRQAGFKENDVTYVPCSGFTGENLAQSQDAKLREWFTSGTLLEAIDSLRTPERAVMKPFRLAVADVFKSVQGSGVTVSGRIEAGYLQKDDRVMLMPSAEMATVKAVLREQEGDQTGAFAGEQVNVSLVGIDATLIASGTVICDPANPIGVTKRVRARVVVFQSLDIPITKGWPVVLHYGSVQIQAIVAKLIAIVSKSNGEVVKKKPRFLQKNCNAIIELSFENPVCMETYAENRELGRFMLRSNGKTVAAGLVTKLVS